MHTTTLNKFGDLEEGDSFRTPGITITDSQILAFAGLTGDFMPHHTDEQFAKNLGFRGRLAHGLLVQSLVDGLKNRSMVHFDVVAALNWEAWRFSGPVYAGDRIDAQITIAGKRLTKSGTKGIVTLDIKVMNQHGEVVQEGRNQLMIAA
ncbi:MaoC/PaaZ C-terminal domain-containing protein [Caballeronia sp. LZ035]|uniref:MaoC family dehydratase n=1 Tax=Caballeronia sp. LZ035 TaxID=3038568 RepID=UPI00286363D3|nr:MaoC/PaaZ C-terminal domain-containing protein [Caballeronia sp. LZ035]MDR5760540.1 MaoC/PaaZ C-terminal domain-containing protein [Caballeronia sp. LZ035]